MKNLIIGGNGFIGGSLTKRLKAQGQYVKVIDLKEFPYGVSEADEVQIADATTCEFDLNQFDRVYQFGADMGGAGFVFTGDNDSEILTNSLSINLNVLRQAKEQGFKGEIFYSSSVCAYPDEVEGKEENAYPANPPSNYGWEKLTSEKLYLAYAKNHGLNPRIARFHNTFGPYGTYEGGREKSPAAICRKVYQATDEIEIWGNGEQLRPFIFIEDLLDGIEALVSSDFTGPVNLGPDDSQSTTINHMVDVVSEIAGKTLVKKHIPGPTGGQVRHANNDLAQEKLHWKPTRDFKESLEITYKWIKAQYES